MYALILAAVLPPSASAQTAFTYQGRLGDNGAPATGQYDLRFSLHDAASAGNAIGSPVTLAPVSVVNGVFTVTLDFGQSAFPGAGRWLEVGVRDNGSSDAYATITPRQPITRAPYAIHGNTANSVAPGAVSGESIANGTISAVDIDATSVGLWSASGGDVHRTSGNVGIGTDTPAAKLHVRKASSGKALHGSADLIVEDVGHAVIQLNSAGSAGGGIYFGSASDGGDAAMRYSTSRDLVFDTDATTRVMIKRSGNVGIGTTSPERRVHIHDGASGNPNMIEADLVVEDNEDAVVQLNSSDGELAGIAFGRNAHSNHGRIFYNASNNLEFWTGGGIPRMEITSGGLVGIGTTSPNTALHVKSDGVPTVIDSANGNTYKIQFSDDGVTRGFIGARTTVAFEVASSTASRLLTVADDGDVGIGTFAPTAKLDVVGTVKATSFSGDGGGLTGLSASALTSGTIDGARIPNLSANKITDGSVDAGWTANPDGSVDALELRDGRLFVGGSFANIGGRPRANLASLNAGTGEADDWNLSANGRVLALAAASGFLHVGGEFTTVGDGTSGVEPSARQNLARFDLSTRRVNNWRADANKPVFAIVADGSRVFVGGAFTSIKGVPREKAAALDVATAAVSGDFFAPQIGVVSGADNTVRALAIANGVLYLGGDFSILRNHDRQFVGAVDIATGDIVMNWDPNANGRVDAILPVGNAVYLGGEFSQVGSFKRNRLAEVASAAGNAAAQVRPWNPNASSAVRALAFQDGGILAGGAFRSVGGAERRFLAAIDKLTGRPTDWAPNPDGEVRALLASGRTLYAGGSFGNVGGGTRSRAAAWDIETGQLISWNPDVTDTAAGAKTGVDALVRRDDRIFLGGSFTHIGGMAHDNLGAVDAYTGMPTAWSAHPNNRVFALAAMGGHLYVGGQFSSVNAVAVGSLARVNLTTGFLDQLWAPAPSSTVLALAGRGGTLYAGGLFRNFGGGSPRRALAALDVAVASPTTWNPQIFHSSNPNFAVNALRIIGDVIYVGGDFEEARGQVRENLAAISLDGDGLPTAWNPNPDAAVHALTGVGNAIYAGGRSTSVAGQVRENLAAFTLPGAPVIVG